MKLPSVPTRRLLPAALAAAMVLTACDYEEVDGVGSRTFDEAAPPQADIQTFGGCLPIELGRWEATATVVNQTEVVSTYELTIGFYDGETRLATRSHWMRDLRPGERADMERSWWVESGERVTECRLLTVNRFG